MVMLDSEKKLLLEEAQGQVMNMMQSLDYFFLGMAKSNDFVNVGHIKLYNQAVEKINNLLGQKSDKILESQTVLLRYSLFRSYLVNLLGILQPYLKQNDQKLSLINEREIVMYPSRLVERIKEADWCYRYGFNTAACALCGTVVEAIILETVGKTKDQTWDDVIVLFCKKFNLEHEKSLMDQLKDWRNKANHLSSLEFDDKRAAIFIQSLLVVGKKVYGNTDNISPDKQSG